MAADGFTFWHDALTDGRAMQLQGPQVHLGANYGGSTACGLVCHIIIGVCAGKVTWPQLALFIHGSEPVVNCPVLAR